MDTPNHDEIILRNMTFANRFMAEWDEKLRIEQQERAEAHGFSNYKEYEKFESQEYDKRMARYEAVMDERCKILGKTREEFEDGQRSVGPERPECNCEGHIIPFFCPQKLLSYNSMVEDPSGLLQYSHPQQIERLYMKEDDPSNRLSDEDLGRYWAMDSQQVPREFPAWVGNDPVLKKMAIEHPSSPPTRSAESSLFTCSPSTSPTLQSIDQSSISKTSYDSQTLASNDSQVHGQQLSELMLKSFPQASSKTMHSSKHPRSKKAGVLRLSMSCGIKKRASKATSRLQKLLRPTIQTRSQDILTFYALGSRNSAVNFRNPRRRSIG